MEPRLNPSLTPKFWEMDPIKEFQPMCRDLLMQEQGIRIAEVYGVSGQKQYGIDILAKNVNNLPCVVGQCKCYENFSPRDLVKAVDEFLDSDNFTYWYQQGVRKFIVFAACDLEHTQQQDEISKQTQKLLTKGVIFEVWSGSVIRNRLAPHREIAGRYINSEEIIKNICGTAPPSLIFQTNDLNKILSELRDAIREPHYYFQDIEKLLRREVESLHHKMNHPTSEYGWIIQPQDQKTYLEYLNHLSAISQKFIHIVLTLIKLDQGKHFHQVIVNCLGKIAQDVITPLNVRGSSTAIDIRMYPLLLIIFSIFIIGTESKAYTLMKKIAETPFRSTEIIYNTPEVLVQVADRILRQLNFFKIAKPEYYAPISVLLLEHLRFQNISDFIYTPLEESFYKAEFIFSLMYLKLNQNYIWPGLFLYLPNASQTLETFINSDNLPHELFPNIEALLREFDKKSVEIHASFGRKYGFYGTAHKVYMASQR